MSDRYKQAGVDIDAGNQAVERMKKHVRRTFRPGVADDLGGFGAMFRLDTEKYKKPVLVSGSDGVGTKLKLAFMMDRHDTVGVDAVAMCVNDIVVQGAEPLFFLDYIACDRVIPEKIEAIVKGIADGCEQAGCALIGGETAEMPDMYSEGEYDIAGFTVGAVEEDQIITGDTIREGDIVLGLPSSGVHSNGFSLVRKVFFKDHHYTLDDRLEELGTTLGEELIKPTRIYVKPILSLMQSVQIKGMAHITGGGLIENIPRILPEGLSARLDATRWPQRPIFQVIQRLGDIPNEDMYRTFNMGIGMTVIVSREDAERARGVLEAAGEEVYQIGEIVSGEGVSIQGW
ncbi:MAG: phosphoribosylformylglycinamidine cyclo-ligase [Bacillaceae bacterium]|nr:phosphoribosylformylglycinamidine cyclo-ligase [Bacillaceae bacterium]